VSVGSRQDSRECGDNVVRAGHEPAELAAAIREQVAHGPYEKNELFGDGTAGDQIADVLATAWPSVQKDLTLDLGAPAGAV
jgi:hypothetical protein